MKRASSLAGDRITVSQVLLEVGEELQRKGETFDSICLLLPTSPFRTAARLKEAWQAFAASDAQTLLSIVPLDHPPQWALTLHGNKLTPLWPDDFPKPRPDLAPAFRHDGGYAFVLWSALQEFKDLLTPNTLGWPISRQEAVDINEPEELLWAEFLLAQQS